MASDAAVRTRHMTSASGWVALKRTVLLALHEGRGLTAVIIRRASDGAACAAVHARSMCTRVGALADFWSSLVAGPAVVLRWIPP